jgi:hypothetical protein
MMKEEAARKIEEHLQVLVDYDVLDAQVADTLTEYVWSIIGEIDPIIDVDKSWLHLVHNMDSVEEEDSEDEEDSE